MTGTYAPPFAEPETSSPTEHGTLVALLGLGLLTMVLAFAWSGLAARLGPASGMRSSADDAATRLDSDSARPMLVEAVSPQWIVEESSP
jgi:hypothetical protein